MHILPIGLRVPVALFSALILFQTGAPGPLLAQGRTIEAADAFRQALQLSPGHPAASEGLRATGAAP